MKVSTSAEPDLQRQVRSTAAFAEDAGKHTIPIVHASDIASMDKPAEFSRAFGDGSGSDSVDPFMVRLQYPGISQGEK